MTRASEWMVLGAVLAFGCGGSDSNGKTTMPSPQEQVAPAPEQAPEPVAAPTPPPAEAPAPVPVEEPVVESKAQRAVAEVKPVGKGDASGTVTFEQDGSKVMISGTFNGLPAGDHGFVIAEDGDCSKKVGKVGAHFNPTKVKHGPPESPTRHAGDLGNLTVDKTGNASFQMETDSLTVSDGADSVVGRAIVITAKKDTGKSENAGKAIACGTIERRDATVSRAP